jgi:SNF2 family DNA or RNA helicase
MLSGSPKRTTAMVMDAQSKSSTLNAGAGLNLTTASYVILYDPWWNPAVEAQAIDRSHRIGQTRTVNAYRLIAPGTVEEKIWELQQRKAQAIADVLGEEGFAKSLSQSDLEYLFSEE